MVEHAQGRAAEAGRVHDAGVDELIQDDDVVFAEQGADGAEGRGVAGGEAERGFGAFEGGQRFVQFLVGRERTADQARGTGAGAVALDGFDGRFLEGRFVGEAEVVVGREVEQRLAGDLDARGLGRINAAQFAQQSLLAQGRQSLSQFMVEVVHLRADRRPGAQALSRAVPHSWANEPLAQISNLPYRRFLTCQGS